MAYNKYGNTKVIIDGIRFDSAAEGTHYCTLKLLKNSGEIRDFKMQVEYIVAQIGNRKRKYRADFVVERNDGTIEVQDVKGVKTSIYSLKKFLMEERHGIKIVEITKGKR